MSTPGARHSRPVLCPKRHLIPLTCAPTLLALAAKHDHRLDDAEAKTREALALEPGNLQAHWVLAWTLAALERKAEAAEEFGKVIELAPDGDTKQEAQAALERMH